MPSTAHAETAMPSTAHAETATMPGQAPTEWDANDANGRQSTAPTPMAVDPPAGAEQHDHFEQSLLWWN